ncbi:hypothetical protein EG328_008274 [Venturia inaequalis]|uniref:Uncharacterized protein n=1 Tax=Venturia inaequalis TaxID=5025 RepID=A0A8H3UEQ8_VENIN|nr:hypothetical protein EG328_008274 [Venturia inaequalis]
MRLQTFLPAIIFAQSSNAVYWCCYKFQATVTFTQYVSSGGVGRWTIGSGCLIRIDKTGPNCGSWKSELVGKTCDGLGEVKSYGVVAAGECK